MHHDHARVVVELHALDDRVLQPQQGTPYPCFLDAVLRSMISGTRQPEIYCGNGVHPFHGSLKPPTDASGDPE